jgi:hypothetical protein
MRQWRERRALGGPALRASRLQYLPKFIRLEAGAPHTAAMQQIPEWTP